MHLDWCLNIDEFLHPTRIHGIKICPVPLPWISWVTPPIVGGSTLLWGTFSGVLPSIDSSSCWFALFFYSLFWCFYWCGFQGLSFLQTFYYFLMGSKDSCVLIFIFKDFRFACQGYSNLCFTRFFTFFGVFGLLWVGNFEKCSYQPKAYYCPTFWRNLPLVLIKLIQNSVWTSFPGWLLFYPLLVHVLCLPVYLCSHSLCKVLVFVTSIALIKAACL